MGNENIYPPQDVLDKSKRDFLTRTAVVGTVAIINPNALKDIASAIDIPPSESKALTFPPDTDILLINQKLDADGTIPNKIQKPKVINTSSPASRLMARIYELFLPQIQNESNKSKETEPLTPKIFNSLLANLGIKVKSLDLAKEHQGSHMHTAFKSFFETFEKMKYIFNAKHDNLGNQFFSKVYAQLNTIPDKFTAMYSWAITDENETVAYVHIPPSYLLPNTGIGMLGNEVGHLVAPNPDEYENINITDDEETTYHYVPGVAIFEALSNIIQISLLKGANTELRAMAGDSIRESLDELSMYGFYRYGFSPKNFKNIPLLLSAFSRIAKAKGLSPIVRSVQEAIGMHITYQAGVFGVDPVDILALYANMKGEDIYTFSEVDTPMASLIDYLKEHNILPDVRNVQAPHPVALPSGAPIPVTDETRHPELGQNFYAYNIHFPHIDSTGRYSEDSVRKISSVQIRFGEGADSSTITIPSSQLYPYIEGTTPSVLLPQIVRTENGEIVNIYEQAQANSTDPEVTECEIIVAGEYRDGSTNSHFSSSGFISFIPPEELYDRNRKKSRYDDSPLQSMAIGE